jgi:hypothetical protein
MSPSGVQDSGLGDGKTVLMVPSVCVCVKRVCRKELSVCTAAQDRRGSGPGPVFFCFLAFLRKIFTSNLFWKDFKKMDPELGAVDHGAEVTCLGATDHDAEVLGLKTISVILL